jgi:hypothetical protein
MASYQVILLSKFEWITLAFVASLPPCIVLCKNFDGLCEKKKQTKIFLKRKKKFSKTKHKSNVQKQSGDNKNAILWTPLLTPFAQIDMFGPKRLGFLLYGERVERNLMGHIMVLVGCLVGSLLSNLNGL